MESDIRRIMAKTGIPTAMHRSPMIRFRFCKQKELGRVDWRAIKPYIFASHGCGTDSSDTIQAATDAQRGRRNTN